MRNDDEHDYPQNSPRFDPDPQISGNLSDDPYGGSAHPPYQPGWSATLPPQPTWPKEKISDRPAQKNIWKIATGILSVITLIFLITTILAYNHVINPTTPQLVEEPAHTPIGPTQPTLIPTGGITIASPDAIATQTTSTPSGNYTATQPGPSCDPNGGTWAPTGPISNITCGTTIKIDPTESRGYLYLQLPQNAAFSANNEIGVTGTLANYETPNDTCVGLAEENASTGFLAEYCNNGNWAIYSISNVGAIIQTLSKSITSTRTSEKLSLTFQGNSLTFTIDSETHQVTISPIQPTKVAITYFSGSFTGSSASVNNFNYTVLSK